MNVPTPIEHLPGFLAKHEALTNKEINASTRYAVVGGILLLSVLLAIVIMRNRQSYTNSIELETDENGN
jgi:uncharacterized integral membrane protein